MGGHATRRHAALLAAGLASLAGCALIDASRGQGAPQPPPNVRVGIFQASVIDLNLDVLFVVDSSPGMAQAQSSLAANLPGFLNAMQQQVGKLPDLHLGVLTSDLGAGGAAIAGCSSAGVALLTVNGCTGITGNFLSDLANTDGTRITNYTGQLADDLACMVEVGETGCPFQQPMLAMRDALDGSVTANEGFLRSSAHLLVVFVTDQDDCSATDPTLFDPNDVALGAAGAFRCFQWGVTCDDGPADPTAAGPRAGCRSRTDSPHMAAAATFATFARGLKTDPTLASFAILAGDPGPVVVDAGAAGSTLEASCLEGTVPVVPGIRLADLADQLPARAIHETICSALDVALDRVGELAATTIGAVDQGGAPLDCLIGNDDASLADLNAQCTVAEVTELDTPQEQRTPVPRCEDSPAATPCWIIEQDSAHCDLDTAHARLTLTNLPAPPALPRFVVDCPPGA